MIHPRAAASLLMFSVLLAATLPTSALLVNVVGLVFITLFTSARALCIIFHFTTVVPMALGLLIIHASQSESFSNIFFGSETFRPVVRFSGIGTALQLFIYPYYRMNLLPVAASSVGLRGPLLNFISAAINGIEDLLRASSTILDALRSRSLVNSVKTRVLELTGVAGTVTAYALRSAIMREAVCSHRGIDPNMTVALHENQASWSGARTHLAIATAAIVAVADYLLASSGS